MNLAQLINATRGDRTQADLARDAGMSQQSLQQYVSGGYPKSNFPDTKNLLGLARCCGVDVRTVIRAAEETLADALGITPGETPRLVELLPPEAAYLTDQEISAFRALIVSAAHERMGRRNRRRSDRHG